MKLSETAAAAGEKAFQIKAAAKTKKSLKEETCQIQWINPCTMQIHPFIPS